MGPGRASPRPPPPGRHPLEKCFLHWSLLPRVSGRPHHTPCPEEQLVLLKKLGKLPPRQCSLLQPPGLGSWKDDRGVETGHGRTEGVGKTKQP